MTNILDARIRRHLLGPLVRHDRKALDAKALSRAIKRIEERAMGESALSELRALVRTDFGENQPREADDTEKVRRWIPFTRALYESRRISKSEYVLFSIMHVEGIHDRRCLDGEYDVDFKPISDAMDKIRREHGLSDDDDWGLDEGPLEYRKLDRDWTALRAAKFTETLREFGLNDLADLHSQDPVEFERCRERGRRACFHKEELAPALRDVVARYEQDARKAAAVGAYSAAVVVLGAAIEGLFLLRCLRSKKKAARVASGLPRRLRPKAVDDPATWTFETLIEVCSAAGWLKPIETKVADFLPRGLAHSIRTMRNHVHPGRSVRDRPWCELEERDFDDAESIYALLFAQLAGGKTQRDR